MRELLCNHRAGSPKAYNAHAEACERVLARPPQGSDLPVEDGLNRAAAVSRVKEHGPLMANCNNLGKLVGTEYAAASSARTDDEGSMRPGAAAPHKKRCEAYLTLVVRYRKTRRSLSAVTVHKND
jgi:hypothetical protein